MILTDHCPLRHIDAIRDSSNARLCRWALELSEYDLEIKYTPGRSHHAADCLSRRPPDADSPSINLVQSVCALPWFDRRQIKVEQLRDPNLKQVIHQLTKKDVGMLDPRYFLDMDGLLYYERSGTERQDKLVAPQSMTDYIIKAYHDAPFSGHQGTERTLARIRRQFYWKNQFKEVKDYCAKCESCARRKPGTTQTCAFTAFSRLERRVVSLGCRYGRSTTPQ